MGQVIYIADRIPLSDESRDFDEDLDFDFDDAEDSEGDYEELDFELEDSPLYNGPDIPYDDQPYPEVDE